MTGLGVIAFALLWLLATVDAAASGYRDAAGRSLRIDKRACYRRAVRRAALIGQAPIAMAFVLAALLALPPSGGDTAATLHAYTIAALAALRLFAPIALIVVLALWLRLVGSLDVRSLTSVLVFGPFLLARPFVAYAGVAIAACSVEPSHRLQIAALGGFAVTLMLLLEPALGRARRRGWIP